MIIRRSFPSLASAWLAIALFAIASVARAEIEFVGILATPQKTLFALTDTNTATTDWVDVGHAFGGYIVDRYEAGTDTLILKKDSGELRLRLRDDAKIQSARLELAGTISFGAGEKVEVTRATLVFEQENVFPLKDGVVYRITPQRRTDGTIGYRIAIERSLASNKTERISAPTVITLPGQPFSVHVGDVGFAFNPRQP